MYVVIVKLEDINRPLNILSWNDASLNGTTSDILNYLTNNNINKLNLNRIYYRLKNNKKFYVLYSYYKCLYFKYDGIEYNKYQYLEYIPLVNARTHLLGQQRKILNNSFKEQYFKVLKRCSYRSISIFYLPFTKNIRYYFQCLHFYKIIIIIIIHHFLILHQINRLQVIQQIKKKKIIIIIILM